MLKLWNPKPCLVLTTTTVVIQLCLSQTTLAENYVDRTSEEVNVT